MRFNQVTIRSSYAKLPFRDSSHLEINITEAQTILVDGAPYSALDVLVLKHDYKETKSHLAKTIADLVRLAESTILPGLPIGEVQLSRLANLTGTPVFQALFIIDALKKTASIPGDVCEYGVATGRTSALIAATLNKLNSSKQLWLYDSFEGLPKPSDKDSMLDDVYGLGRIEKYQGYFSFPEEHVRRALEEVNFAAGQTVICKGWITAESLLNNSPSLISCCYLDMDFYQSTKDVLNLLGKRMPTHGIAIIDDYGFFSTGVKTAVDEAVAENPGAFSISRPFNDKFVILTKTS